MKFILSLGRLRVTLRLCLYHIALCLVLVELGIKPSQAITLFCKQIVRQRGLPFAARIPNNKTIKALNEDLSKQKRFFPSKNL